MGDYVRVIPRDLFNEASLLKCYGMLAIKLGETRGHAARIVEEELDAFEIVQDDSSGATTIANVTFTIHGVRHHLERRLNAREDWPLSVEGRDGDPDFEGVDVFDERGELSADMLRLIDAAD